MVITNDCKNMEYLTLTFKLQPKLASRFKEYRGVIFSCTPVNAQNHLLRQFLRFQSISGP